VRDMLRPTTEPQVPLEIRQHPRVGVFVEGQSQNVVTNPQEVARLIDFGNKIRVVGRTNMNMTSSRSHAVVTWQVEQRLLPPGTTRAVRRRATLHAVDLAGSERMSDAGGNESRQKESSQINRSLTYLSLMISRLASQATGTATLHVPYRNSKLTFLLSDSLMGNCRTAMVACVSPASQHAAMTLHSDLQPQLRMSRPNQSRMRSWMETLFHPFVLRSSYSECNFKPRVEMQSIKSPRKSG